MICPRCKAEMYINSWDGWIWECSNCPHIDRKATDEEIEKEEAMDMGNGIEN